MDVLSCSYKFEIEILKKGLFDDKEYFQYLKFMQDGIKNRVDKKKCPFILIK